MSKVTPFLMFSDRLGEAIEFYRTLFPDFELRTPAPADDSPIESAEFVIGGQTIRAFNGGPSFSFSAGFSLFVDCEDQAEVDRFWDALLAAGGTPVQCGWIRDPFDLSWQIVPRRFAELVGDPNPKKAKAVVDAMLKMQKLDVAALERAHAEA